MVRLLIENQAEVNAIGKDRETPLHIAVGNGNFEFSGLIFGSGKKSLNFVFLRI